MSTPSTRQLFDQAQPLAGSERVRFLDTACPDREQRALLERLLAAADVVDTEPPLQRDPAQWAKDIGDSGTYLQQDIGQQIGPFRIEALLGEGGSARVFRASRVTEGVTQTVALKVLRHGMAASNARQQFDRERHALVRLDHPGIARFIDAGTTARGEAFIALEFIDGLPLLEHVRSLQLPFRERLGLMIRITDAVSAAHRSLVVHRDLKPGNVLVTRTGEIKLLDFGIAKLLEPATGEASHTQTQFRAFTPAYAAPEQREGGSVTTATDVYALGVLLGELLTGQRISDTDTTAPSTRVPQSATAGVLPAETQQTRRLLRGDLDNILMKATATAAESRYATAAAFAEDLQRLLDGQPVRAHPVSRSYRLRKFIARHRGAVATALVVSLGILTALAAALWQAGIARQEAERARAVTGFLVGLFRATEDRLPRNQRPTPEQLIDTAHKQLAENSALDGGTRSEIEATLAEVSRLGARYEQASALYRDAARSLGAVPGNDPRALRIRAGQARVLQQMGRHREALDEIAALKDVPGFAMSEHVLLALEVESAARLSLAQPDAAIAAARERLQRARSRFGPEHPDTLRAAMSLGVALATLERFREAVAELGPAVGRWRAQALPTDRDFMQAAAAEAEALYGLSELSDAQQRIEELLRLQRSIYREPHDEIAATLRSYASILAGAGRSDEAIALHRESIAMLRAVLGEDHPQLVAGQTQLGIALAGAYRLDEAESAYLQAVEICSRAELRSAACARARSNLGMTYYRQARYPEAKTEIEEALRRNTEIFGEQHLNIAVSLSMLANVAMADGRAPEAVTLSERALAIMQAIGMADSRDALLVRNSLAAALWRSGNPARALQEIDHSIEGFDRVQPKVMVRRTMMRVQRAQILRDLGREAEARSTALDAIALQAPGEQLPPRTRQLLRDFSGQSDLFPGLD